MGGCVDFNNVVTLTLITGRPRSLKKKSRLSLITSALLKLNHNPLVLACFDLTKQLLGERSLLSANNTSSTLSFSGLLVELLRMFSWERFFSCDFLANLEAYIFLLKYPICMIFAFFKNFQRDFGWQKNSEKFS